MFKCAYQSIDIDLPRKTNSKKVRPANASRYQRYILVLPSLGNIVNVYTLTCTRNVNVYTLSIV